MLSSFDRLRAALGDFVRDEEAVDPGELRSLIDRLEGKFAQVVRQASQRGDHLVRGHCSAVSWVMDTCSMSQGSASDRLCVGKQLESLPAIEEALGSGQIGYQSVSVICHLSEKLGEKGVTLDEAEWIGYARQFSIKDLRALSDHTRYVVDPDGYDREVEENYAERFLHISEMNGMFQLKGVMDPEGGAALKTAIDALAKRLDQDDSRTPKQRRADALTELTHHALQAGTLPRRNRVRPHITVTTTLEGLKGELGAAASELQPGMLVSSKTVLHLPARRGGRAAKRLGWGRRQAPDRVATGLVASQSRPSPGLSPRPPATQEDHVRTTLGFSLDGGAIRDQHHVRRTDRPRPGSGATPPPGARRRPPRQAGR